VSSDLAGRTVELPLSTGLVVFPLSNELLVFCAGETVAVATTTKTLSPTEFAVMVELRLVAQSSNVERLFGLPGNYGSPLCPCARPKQGAENVTKPPEPFSSALFASLAFNKVSNSAENVCRCDQTRRKRQRGLHWLPFISFALYYRVNLRTCNDNSDPDQKLEKSAPSCRLG
jgi:hypothetical protein